MIATYIWYTYLIGVIVAFFMETKHYGDWCKKQNIDPFSFVGFMDVLIVSIGSWIVVLDILMDNEK